MPDMTPQNATPRSPRLLASLLITGAVALVPGCLSTPAIPDVELVTPTTAEKVAVHLPGIHNLVTYEDDLLCGGVPEGEEGFATLQKLGVKTVISVDGATPDVASAEKFGLRYVHLPISYDTVTVERQTQLAQAICNVERPIFVHCHHGKHRSGAALGTALVRAGKLTPDEVAERMGVSGTAKSYTGLWAAVREAKALGAEELKADPASFPSITTVTGLVATMAELDQVIDLVKQAHEAQWRAPDDHPDLVAAKETARLAKLMASLRDDEESQAYEPEYQRMLQHSIDASQKLDDAVQAGNFIQAAQMLSTVSKSCKACHRSYRNK